jgi:hypothetical protein
VLQGRLLNIRGAGTEELDLLQALLYSLRPKTAVSSKILVISRNNLLNNNVNLSDENNEEAVKGGGCTKRGRVVQQ